MTKDRTEQLKKLGTWLSYLDYFKPSSRVFICQRPPGQTTMQPGTAWSNFFHSMVIGNTNGYKGLLKVQLSLVHWQGLLLPLLWHLFPEVKADPSKPMRRASSFSFSCMQWGANFHYSSLGWKLRVGRMCFCWVENWGLGGYVLIMRVTWSWAVLDSIMML